MGDTANGSWSSQELGGHVHRQEARKAEQDASNETLTTAEQLAKSAASEYEGTMSTLDDDLKFLEGLRNDFKAMYMAGFQSGTKISGELRGLHGWELFGPDGALVERTAQLIAHRVCCGNEADGVSKFHGYCVVCGIPWPCAYAGLPPVGESWVPPKPTWRTVICGLSTIRSLLNAKPVEVEEHRVTLIPDDELWNAWKRTYQQGSDDAQGEAVNGVQGKP